MKASASPPRGMAVERSRDKRLVWVRLWKHSVEWETLAYCGEKGICQQREMKEKCFYSAKADVTKPCRKWETVRGILHNGRYFSSQRQEEKGGKGKDKGHKEGNGRAKLVLTSVLLPGSFEHHPVFLSIKFYFFSECPEL